MSSERQKNMEKRRKTDAEKTYERLDNEGRFAGDDADSRAAERQAKEEVKNAEAHNKGGQHRDEGPTNAEANLHPTKSNFLRGEAQNVVADPSEPGQLGGNEKDVEHGIHKANEGDRQGRS